MFRGQDSLVPEFQRELIQLAPVLRAYALILTRRCGSEADDLVQDTLERAWRARDQFQPGSSLKAWLFTILRHSQHNEWRRSRRLVDDPDGEHAAGLRTEAVQGWRAEFADVLTAMHRLDAASRHALLLVTAGLSYEETAAVCQTPLRTVQSRVRRARQRLADELESDAPRTAPRLRAAVVG